jgi:pyruvate dehydrogenase E1 component
MVFVRLLSKLMRLPEFGPRVVPIVADEARTFGMQDMFRQVGIYSPWGQLYEPQDSDQLAFYREDLRGQILEEGITEAGSLASWIAAGTSYSTNALPMVPFFIFYSMFGFQRVGDLIWAAADSQARGFLLGATAGRTTLSGEGLQHEDGQSHVYAATVPACRAYDPAFGYEVAVIVKDGIRAMSDPERSMFYYVTLYNENAPQPAMPDGAEEGIRRGMHRVRSSAPGAAAEAIRVQLLGSGSILREVLAAAELLESEYGIGSDVWSVTSFGELRRDALEAERWNRLHPDAAPRASWIARCLGTAAGPVVAATDFVRAYPDLIRAWIPGRYVALGTDGFGRSDTRAALRDFFEVDRRHIALAAMTALAEDGKLARGGLAATIDRLGIEAARRPPWEF